jgi:hypothetical protein
MNFIQEKDVNLASSSSQAPFRSHPAYKTTILQEPDRARMSGMGDNVSRRMLDPPLVLELEIFPPGLLKSDFLAGPAESSADTDPCHTNPSFIPPIPPSVSHTNGTTDQSTAMSLGKSSHSIGSDMVTLACKSSPAPSPSSSYSDFQLQNLSNLIICSVTLLHHTNNTLQSCADIPPPPHRPHLSRYVSILMGQTIRNATYTQMEDGSKKHLFVFSDLSVRIQGRFRLCCTITHILT